MNTLKKEIKLLTKLVPRVKKMHYSLVHLKDVVATTKIREEKSKRILEDVSTKEFHIKTNYKKVFNEYCFIYDKVSIRLLQLILFYFAPKVL